MHAKGLGIPQNLPEAIRLFEAVGKPEDSTDAFAARIELGRIYPSGTGLPVDVSKARDWYKCALALANDRDDSDEVLEEKHTLPVRERARSRQVNQGIVSQRRLKNRECGSASSFARRLPLFFRSSFASG
jgi:hypothetical protein